MTQPLDMTQPAPADVHQPPRAPSGDHPGPPATSVDLGIRGWHREVAVNETREVLREVLRTWLDGAGCGSCYARADPRRLPETIDQRRNRRARLRRERKPP
jgi:hypothetical protein